MIENTTIEIENASAGRSIPCKLVKRSRAYPNAHCGRVWRGHGITGNALEVLQQLQFLARFNDGHVLRRQGHQRISKWLANRLNCPNSERWMRAILWWLEDAGIIELTEYKNRAGFVVYSHAAWAKKTGFACEVQGATVESDCGRNNQKSGCYNQENVQEQPQKGIKTTNFVGCARAVTDSQSETSKSTGSNTAVLTATLSATLHATRLADRLKEMFSSLYEHRELAWRKTENQRLEELRTKGSDVEIASAWEIFLNRGMADLPDGLAARPFCLFATKFDGLLAEVRECADEQIRASLENDLLQEGLSDPREFVRTLGGNLMHVSVAQRRGIAAADVRPIMRDPVQVRILATNEVRWIERGKIPKYLNLVVEVRQS